MNSIFQAIEDYKQKHKEAGEALVLFEKALLSLHGDSGKLPKELIKKAVILRDPKRGKKPESSTTTTGAS